MTRVAVWALGPAALDRLGARLAACASPAERALADRVPRQAPVRAAAYGLARLVLGHDRADLLERAPAGWPRLQGTPDLWLSLTHGPGGIAFALGPGPLGVDVEATAQPWADLLPHLDPGLPADLPGTEAVGVWCLFEALGKARRSGIAPVLDAPPVFDRLGLAAASDVALSGGLTGRVRRLERGRATLALCRPAGSAVIWHGARDVVRRLRAAEAWPAHRSVGAV